MKYLVKILSYHPEKKDYSGLCKKKDWGYIIESGSENASYGYASKKQAKAALKQAVEQRGFISNA